MEKKTIENKMEKIIRHLHLLYEDLHEINFNQDIFFGEAFGEKNFSH